MLRSLTVALALMSTVSAVAVEKLLPPPGNAAPTGAPPDQVTGWLQPLAGRGAMACGMHPAASTASPALDCAADALRESKPFWVVFQELGTDTSAWQGIVRNAQGKAWQVRFDGGSTMANMQRLHSVTVYTCLTLVVDGNRIRCDSP